MRKRLLPTAMLAMAACILFSCKKDNNDPNDPPGNNPDEEVLKILQSLRIEDSEGDAFRVNFKYNDKGYFIGTERIAELIRTGFGKNKDNDDSGNILWDLDEKGNIIKEEFSVGDFSHSNTYTYDAQGNPTTGKEVTTYIETGESTTLNIVYTVTNKTVTTIKLTDPNGFENTIQLTYKNGNIIKTVVTAHGEFLMEFNWTFGKEKSPYYAKRLNWCLRPSTHIPFYNANVETSVRSRIALPDFDAEDVLSADTTVYRADADGYPAYAATVTQGETDSTRVTYTYKK